MKFVMPRDFSVKQFGHSIRFEKDKPMHVPPALHAEVRKWGGVPAEGEEEAVQAEIDAEASKDPGFQKPSDEPQGEPRTNMLLEACDALVGRNSSKDFGGNGAPKITAILDMVGFRIDANERNTIWALYNKRKNEAINPSNANETEDPVIPDSE